MERTPKGNTARNPHEAARQRTGKTRARWLGLLDRHGAKALPHKQITARYRIAVQHTKLDDAAHEKPG